MEGFSWGCYRVYFRRMVVDSSKEVLIYDSSFKTRITNISDGAPPPTLRPDLKWIQAMALVSSSTPQTAQPGCLIIDGKYQKYQVSSKCVGCS